MIEDRFSSSGWFDEERIEKTTPQTDDERRYISGGNVPFRDLVVCQHCKKKRVADSENCPYCEGEQHEWFIHKVPSDIRANNKSKDAAALARWGKKPTPTKPK